VDKGHPGRGERPETLPQSAAVRVETAANGIERRSFQQETATFAVAVSLYKVKPGPGEKDRCLACLARREGGTQHL